MDLTGLILSKMAVDKPEFALDDLPDEALAKAETATDFSVLVDQSTPKMKNLEPLKDGIVMLAPEPISIFPQIEAAPNEETVPQDVPFVAIQPKSELPEFVEIKNPAEILASVDPIATFTDAKLPEAPVNVKTLPTTGEKAIIEANSSAAQERPALPVQNIVVPTLQLNRRDATAMPENVVEKTPAASKAEIVAERPVAINAIFSIAGTTTSPIDWAVSPVPKNLPPREIETFKSTAIDQKPKATPNLVQSNFLVPATAPNFKSNSIGDMTLSVADQPELKLSVEKTILETLKPELSARATIQTPVGKIAEQIAIRIVNTSDPRIEIRLDPPELGRVTVQMSPSETGMQAILTAERPDIADLMRRHIDLLASALERAGFSQNNLQFRSGEQGSKGFNQPTTSNALPDLDIESEASDKIYSNFVPGTALDIRL